MRDKEKVKAYNKKYREQNKEKIKQLMRDYYYSNRESQIQKANQWRLDNKERHLKTRREYMKTPVGKLSSVKGSAKTRNIEYNISDEFAFILLESNCYYCGNSERIGIDRIDSNIGYIEKNCVPCCYICNMMKNTFSKDEFIAQCKKITNKHKPL